jgi:hypothetical protein
LYFHNTNLAWKANTNCNARLKGVCKLGPSSHDLRPSLPDNSRANRNFNSVCDDIYAKWNIYNRRHVGSSRKEVFQNSCVICLPVTLGTVRLRIKDLTETQVIILRTATSEELLSSASDEGIVSHWAVEIGAIVEGGRTVGAGDPAETPSIDVDCSFTATKKNLALESVLNNGVDVVEARITE